MASDKRKLFYAKKEKSRWILGNRKFKAAISKDSGTVESFIINTPKAEMSVWDGAAGVEIHDRQAKLDYSDLSDRVSMISSKITQKKNAAVLKVVKHIEGADFDIEEDYQIFEDHLKWDLTIKTRRKECREVALDFALPLPRTTPLYMAMEKCHWRFWAATHDAPGDIETINHRTFSYDHIWDNHISIPAFCLYEPELDIGLTMVKPFELPIPSFRFNLSNVSDFNVENASSLKAENLYLRSGGGHSPKASLILIAHEGDWRPGLGWLFDKYKDHFMPGNAKVHDIEGSMVCGCMGGHQEVSSEKTIAQLKKAGLAWEEIHCYFPHYGVYVPEKEPWWSLEKLHKRPKPYRVTTKKMKEYIDFLHKQDVKNVLYWHTGLIYGKLAKKNQAESISRDADGNELLHMRHGHAYYWVNFDVNLPAGEYMLDQARKLIETYPKTDGLFIDNLCYRYFDFGHDDGITMVDGKKCYKVTFAYPELIKKVCELAHKKNKVTFCNGPVNVEIQRHIDGHMAEGANPELLAYVGYLGLVKPIVSLPYNMAEETIIGCLKYGAYPSVVFAPTEEDIDLFVRYRPVFDCFRGRRWVLTPHALRLPEGIDGNIFKTRGGDYIVPLLPGRKSVVDEGGFCKDVQIEVNLDDAGRISNIYLFSVDTQVWSELDFARRNKRIKFVVPEHGTASMALLSKKKIAHHSKPNRYRF